MACYKRYTDQLDHNRKMLKVLCDFDFSKRIDTSTGVSTKQLPQNNNSFEEDEKELLKIKQVLANEDVDLAFFNNKFGNVQNIEDVISCYCKRRTHNTHFKICNRNGGWRISYRNGFYYSLTTATNIIIEREQEHKRLVGAFRLLKNTHMLDGAIKTNSLKYIAIQQFQRTPTVQLHIVE